MSGTGHRGESTYEFVRSESELSIVQFGSPFEERSPFWGDNGLACRKLWRPAGGKLLLTAVVTCNLWMVRTLPEN